MAITIRNKETEELIRRIGRRTGEGPSAVIRRLAENENKHTGTVPPDEVARRLKVFEDLRRQYPPPNDGLMWSEIEEEMDSIFGDDQT